MPAICKHYFVSGLVQGVFFRRGASDKAIALGLHGWVKNTADERVEVIVCGEADVVKEMEDWLKKGPEKARVDKLDVTEMPWQKFSSFEIRY